MPLPNHFPIGCESFRRITFQFCLILLVASLYAGSASGQDEEFGTLTLNATSPTLSFDSGDEGDHDFRIFGRSTGSSLDLDGKDATCLVRIFSDTAANTVLIDGTNVRVGKPVFVTDLSSEATRDVITLRRNGGASILFEDFSASAGRFKLENINGQFEIVNVNTGASNLRINPDATANLLNLGQKGVGVGVSNPTATVHVLADGTTTDLETANMILEVTDALDQRTRNMFQLKNNGPIIQTFTDTSSADAAIYQIGAQTDRFSIQRVSGTRPGMILFEDGAVRFVANQKPNFTITGSGTLNVVGSAPGGGNLNVGVGGDISPTDGNLFVKRNINYGGELNGPSDRNIKENFQKIDPKEILRKVSKLPITRWNYITDSKKISHVGPMAQDFMAAFKVGSSDKHISMMDSDGVSLAAIKGLSQIVSEKEKTIANQAKEIAQLKAELASQADAISELSEGLERLESLVVPSSNE